jgi:nucleotide-binding universal stress UspA family protein
VKIVVGYLRSPEGRAALRRAIEEARLRDGELLVVHSMRGGERDDDDEVRRYQEEFEQLEERLRSEQITSSLVEYTRGQDPAGDLLQVVADEGAELLVIGVRRRSPVGKLVLGSNAQQILLRADCAVLAVKADEDLDG